MRSNPLKRKLDQDLPTFGVWITLESPNITEAFVNMGIDWIVIEMEHGHLDWSDVINHVRVTAGSETAALVRIPETQRNFVQRAFDIGADGIVCPMIGNRHQLEAAFQFGRFPPRGERGVGGERSVMWGLHSAASLECADRETMIIPLLETREAVENIDSILEVDGLSTVFFGPADMSASFGYLGQWDGPGVMEAILQIRAKANRRGIRSGILARDDSEAQLRREQGFRDDWLGG